MSEISSNKKRIAKNTLMLYVRMLLVMGVGLYTSRVILKALGIDDFGLYNIIGGIVVLFTFLNNAMVASTQRFLNFELGCDNKEEAKKIFSASLSVHMAISVIFLLIAETLGLWFLNTYIQVPDGRETAANWVYQFTVITSVINILRAPYNAVIIAYERMSFYAYISIIEVVAKLAIVYLVYLFIDRLIAYSILMAGISLIVFGGYYLFCRKNFSICGYVFEYDRKRYISITSFSGWSLLGSAANLGAQQGLNVLLNIFFGVAVNAAMGIANQVSNAVYQFVSNFQTAFNPQIVKTYAAQNNEEFAQLVYSTSRYSFFLLLTLALPIFVCCDELLDIWLTEVPAYATEFCRIMIVNALFDALSGPLWMSVYASGKISWYQMVISGLLFMTLILAYVISQFGFSPAVVLGIKPLIGFLVYLFRMLYCSSMLKLSLRDYWSLVVNKCLLIGLASGACVAMLAAFWGVGLVCLFLKILTSIAVTVVFIVLFGLSAHEKKLIMNLIRKH